MASKTRFALGLDYGTETMRAVLVNLESGRIAGSAAESYPHGVITASLPDSPRTKLEPQSALQHPGDYLHVLKKTVSATMKEAKAHARQVVGLGVDFTSCTMLPTTKDGLPLCELSRFKNHPQAYVKLWKHHTAQPQADRINQLAAARGEGWPKRFGGSVSSEWFLPKALEILEKAPDVYRSAEVLIEAGEWLVWQLTGQLTRSTCHGGYKQCWSRRHGYPSREFLGNLNPEFANLVENKMSGPRLAPGMKAGGLTEKMAKWLGLLPGTAVSSSIIDAHAAVPGCGVTKPGELCLVIGTSSCLMLMHKHEQFIPGIAGVVEDGILPGYYGYEAGQAAVGDTFAWLADLLAASNPRESQTPRNRRPAVGQRQAVFETLQKQAAELPPGAGGLLALDWFNGCRTPFADSNLSGLLLGLTLNTTAAQLYRALIEATAFGTRSIVDTFSRSGLEIASLVAGGGVARKNALLMQIYADVLNRPIQVAASEEASALGAAILGAVAAGPENGGFVRVEDAVQNMVPEPLKVYKPDSQKQEVYRTLYDEYQRLAVTFGRYENPVMRNLRKLAGGKS